MKWKFARFWGCRSMRRVETFEDTGEVFLKHANRASELPGVDMTQPDTGAEDGSVASHE